ncbi:MAG: cysteine hydrolase [Oscillospiraceae bacterium]|nr:cysteine hydrolase [Oscillospiraceae bacterium]
MKKILIVVDMQTDFIDGSLGTKEAVTILPMVEKKIQNFDGEIIFTRDTHTKDYLDTREGRLLPVNHCIQGTEGWQIHPLLQKYCKRVIDKPTFGSVALAKELEERFFDNQEIEITLIGLCTDICVISNAMLIKASLPEAEVIIDAACCAGVTPESHQKALDAMKMCQIAVIGE